MSEPVDRWSRTGRRELVEEVHRKEGAQEGRKAATELG